uniref:Uncharacterized protein n=1 Tax=Anguilla anguilla TaxID=7936 RepID=A0A0E9Q2I1_ANGAN
MQSHPGKPRRHSFIPKITRNSSIIIIIIGSGDTAQVKGHQDATAVWPMLIF